ncbi:MAG: hypothetical protein CFH21_00291 [Alphaproteobacteria bacterium MarineAlpha5_Bin11]|mgnify:CR=1 FL=1|nr:TIGR02300 family protein [Pelagibacteraceae bacterium]PPR44580.1 MAG: hypothetical protein CFH21_00291 [Alphaproteobacteria bacterium MarineAlpha5_Bin11]PPR50876.1 MAG: hypothetical protein CFH20_00842 [Alphaproteobacteria bacterium MarineAlpha5_Bin10]|tara:strand:- start:10522 stop:10881 length:360 start_codon:yes stop_codon:yes gene_type:complete
MYKTSWGLKRICPICRASYYDLGRTILECPSCGKEIEVLNLSRPRRGRKPGSVNAFNNASETEEVKQKVEENIDIDNVELETDSNENNIEDDTVLIEEESDIDPAIDVGIKPTEDKEET